MWRGAKGLCPNCGQGRLFAAYLKVRAQCSICGEAFHHHRADDAPPYFTIFLTGHIVVPLLMAVELSYSPPVFVHLILWLPLTIMLSLLFLPIVKGAIVTLQWAKRMHGFGAEEEHDGLHSFAKEGLRHTPVFTGNGDKIH